MSNHSHGRRSFAVAGRVWVVIVAVVALIAVATGWSMLRESNAENRADCSETTVVTIAVEPNTVDLKSVAESLNDERVTAGNTCIDVVAIEATLAAIARGDADPDLWIPASSLTAARLDALFPGRVVSKPVSIGSSPVNIAVPFANVLYQVAEKPARATAKAFTGVPDGPPDQPPLLLLPAEGNSAAADITANAILASGPPDPDPIGYLARRVIQRSPEYAAILAANGENVAVPFLGESLGGVNNIANFELVTLTGDPIVADYPLVQLSGIEAKRRRAASVVLRELTGPRKELLAEAAAQADLGPRLPSLESLPPISQLLFALPTQG